MNLLFDTQALVDWIAGKRFRHSLRRTIERPSTVIYISVITPWEITMNWKLNALGISAAQVWSATETLGSKLLAVSRQHVEMHAQLPLHPEHRDPFDRMLIAQALSENLTLVGADTRFELYRGLKVLW